MCPNGFHLLHISLRYAAGGKGLEESHLLTLPGVILTPFRILRKPALENAFLLGYYFADAPEAGECCGPHYDSIKIHHFDIKFNTASLKASGF